MQALICSRRSWPVFTSCVVGCIDLTSIGSLWKIRPRVWFWLLICWICTESPFCDSWQMFLSTLSGQIWKNLLYDGKLWGVEQNSTIHRSYSGRLCLYSTLIAVMQQTEYQFIVSSQPVIIHDIWRPRVLDPGETGGKPWWLGMMTHSNFWVARPKDVMTLFEMNHENENKLDRCSSENVL